MFVFITHPRYFDKNILRGKKVDLIYIFDSSKLYKELSKKYNCVNIGKNGLISNTTLKSIFLDEEILFESRKMLFGYVDKWLLSILRKTYVMKKSYNKKFVFEMAYERYKYSKKEASEILYKESIDTIFQIIAESYSQKWISNNIKNLELIFNYSKSFFEAYADLKNIYRELVEIYFLSFFTNVVLYYYPNSFDFYKNGFHFNYLKVLSRLFIEKYHKSDFEEDLFYKVKMIKDDKWW